MMKNPGANDQIELSLEACHLEQIHGPHHQISQLVPLSQPLLMGNARIREIDARHPTFGIIECDHRGLH
jgi:hypothetical protein